MQLPVQSFASLVEQMAAGLQGRAAALIDLTVGSVLRSILESCASVILWLQWLVVQVLATTRAATSNGADLDSWMADFSFSRLPGSAATGLVTFSRYTAGLTASVPVGTTVMTADGTQSFAVTADSTNPAWNGSTGYIIAAQAMSITVPTVCISTGSSGNVQAGTVSVLTSPIPGVDTVSNTGSFVGCAAAESDVAFRARFQLYINSLSQATVLAIQNAVSGVQQGLRFAVIENQNAALAPAMGAFVVTVDDGTGSPSNALLASVSQAVDAVRPIGSVFSVQPPAIVPATVSMVLVTSNPLTHAAVAATARQAISAWIASLPMGGTLAVSKLDALAHAADASVLSVTSTLINNSANDLSAPANGVIMAASVTVS